MDKSNKDLQDTWRLLMKGLVGLALVASCLGGCAYVNSKFNVEDDHPAEEFLEDLIEFHLGLPADSVDFTPNG